MTKVAPFLFISQVDLRETCVPGSSKDVPHAIHVSGSVRRRALYGLSVIVNISQVDLLSITVGKVSRNQ